MSERGFPTSAKPQIATGYPSGTCKHDWRLNPVVTATGTHTSDHRELWTCSRCGAQIVGPPLVPRKPVGRNTPVIWNEPMTWEKR